MPLRSKSRVAYWRTSGELRDKIKVYDQHDLDVRLGGVCDDVYDARRRSDDFALGAEARRELHYRTMPPDRATINVVVGRGAQLEHLGWVGTVMVRQSGDVAALRRAIVKRGGLDHAPWSIAFGRRLLASEELLATAGIGDGALVLMCHDQSPLEGFAAPMRRTTEFAIAAAESREARYRALVRECCGRSSGEDAFRLEGIRSRGDLTKMLKALSWDARWSSGELSRRLRAARLLAWDIASREALYGHGGEEPIFSGDALEDVSAHLWSADVQVQTDAALAVEDFVMLGRSLTAPLLLTLHASTPGLDGRVIVTFTNISGDEQAAVEADVGDPVGTVRERLAREMNRHPRSMALMLASGCYLQHSCDAQPLSEVLAAPCVDLFAGEAPVSRPAASGDPRIGLARAEAASVRRLVEISGGDSSSPS